MNRHHHSIRNWVLSAAPVFNLVAIAVLMSGCTGTSFTTPSTVYEYDKLDVALPSLPSQSVIVAVQDRRSYILDGQKRSDFVGQQRLYAGKLMDVGTASAKPLAEDLAVSIASSFTAKGATATWIAFQPNDTDAQVLGELQRADADYVFLLKIRDLNSQAVVNVSLAHDFFLQLYSPSQNFRLLADARHRGDEKFGAKSPLPIRYARKTVPRAVGEALSTLFATESVARAFSR